MLLAPLREGELSRAIPFALAYLSPRQEPCGLSSASHSPGMESKHLPWSDDLAGGSRQFVSTNL